MYILMINNSMNNFLFPQVEELPFLLARCQELDRLKKVISDLDVFYRLSESEDGTFELIKAWKTVMLGF